MVKKQGVFGMHPMVVVPAARLEESVAMFFNSRTTKSVKARVTMASATSIKYCQKRRSEV